MINLILDDCSLDMLVAIHSALGKLTKGERKREHKRRNHRSCKSN